MSKEVETGNEPSRHLPGVGQGVVEEDELVVVRVAVKLSPDGVLKPGSQNRLTYAHIIFLCYRSYRSI